MLNYYVGVAVKYVIICITIQISSIFLVYWVVSIFNWNVVYFGFKYFNILIIFSSVHHDVYKYINNLIIYVVLERFKKKKKLTVNVIRVALTNIISGILKPHAYLNIHKIT